MNKVLIVDDSATMRKIIMRVLQQANLSVDAILEARSGIEGLERLASDPDIQVILSDINMPEMNGIEFVRAVRKSHEKEALPVVMIATEGAEPIVQSAIDLGANGYVTKPFTPETIRETLEQFLE